jgi:hypothetical protein
VFKQRVQAESDDLIQKLEAGYKALKSGRMSKQDYSALVDATEKKLDRLLDQYETDTRTLRKAQSFAGSADSKEFSQMSNKMAQTGSPNSPAQSRFQSRRARSKCRVQWRLLTLTTTWCRRW